MVVDDAQLLARLPEAERELAAIVRLQLTYRLRRHVPKLPEKSAAEADEWLVYAPANANRVSTSIAV